MAVTNPTAQMNPMAALYGPDVARQQYELAQNQRYADILMQQALMEQPQGQMVSGHYVPPSPIQGLGQLLKAYVARKSSDLIPERQAKIDIAQDEQLRRMVGLGGGTTAPQARDMALAGGAMQGDVGPTNTNAVRMQNVQTGQGSAVPLIGENPMLTYTTLRYGGPQAYAKALVEQQMPTSEMKTLVAAGYRPGTPEFQAAAKNLAFKNAYVAPTTVAPGAGLVMPGQTSPSFYAAQGGIQNIPGPNGQVSAVTVPGYGQASGKIEQYQSFGRRLGEAGATPATRIDLDTGNTVGATQADVMNLQGNPYAAQPSPVAQPKPPVVTAINPVVQKANEQLNDQWIRGVLEPTRASASSADKILTSVDVLQNLDFKTGFGTKAQAEVANVLSSFGVTGAEKLATNAQLFEKEGAKALLSTLEKQKGSQTERDAITGKETFVRLSDTPQAKDFTLDLAKSMALRDKHKADYFERAVNMTDAHKGKLGTISEAYKAVDPSVFDMPIGQTPDGKPITMRTKYGIK